MNWIDCRGGKWTAVLVAALVFGLPSLAAARTESLRWTHVTPSAVTGYNVHWGTTPGSYPNVSNTGSLTPGADGIVHYDLLNVPDADTIYIAVTAYDGQVESAYSNERVRVGTTPPPDDPPVDPPADPPANADFVEDFEANATGTNVPGWVDTEANGSLLENDALFSVADLAGDRVLMTSSSATDIHSHRISTESASWSSYEVRARVLVGSSDGRLGVTSTSHFRDEAVLYRLSGSWQNGEIELHGVPWDNGSKACVSKGTGVIPQVNTWYEMRLQVIPKSGYNLLRGKVWQVGAAEPSGWQAECQDSAANRPVAGTIGVWSGRSGSKYWDDFAVIQLDSNGDIDGEGGSGDPPNDPPDPDPEPLTAPGTPFLLSP